MRYVMLLLLAVPLAGEDKPAPATQLASMAWLAGEWVGPMGGGEFHAYYSTPEGGKILSYSRLLAGGRVRFHEFEVFQVADGAVTLTPHPGGRPAASFRLTASAKDQATFANPANDWPKQLVYHRKAQDNLVITLSGGGKVTVYDLRRPAGK